MTSSDPVQGWGDLTGGESACGARTALLRGGAQDLLLHLEVPAQLGDHSRVAVWHLGLDVSQWHGVGPGQRRGVLDHQPEQRLQLLERECDRVAAVGPRLYRLKVHDESVDDICIELPAATGFDVGAKRRLEIIYALRYVRPLVVSLSVLAPSEDERRARPDGGNHEDGRHDLEISPYGAPSGLLDDLLGARDLVQMLRDGSAGDSANDAADAEQASVIDAGLNPWRNVEGYLYDVACHWPMLCPMTGLRPDIADQRSSACH